MEIEAELQKRKEEIKHNLAVIEFQNADEIRKYNEKYGKQTISIQPKVGDKRQFTSGPKDDYFSEDNENDILSESSYGGKRKKRLSNNANKRVVKNDDFSSQESYHSDHSRIDDDFGKNKSRIAKTLHAAGITDDLESQVHHDFKRDDFHQKEREYEQKLASLRSQPAEYDDLKRITMRRAKIEEWVDEPFFNSTMKNSFVNLSFGAKKYILSEVIDIKEDWNAPYTLSNGKKTGTYLKLMFDTSVN